jgi:hypothetical protein
MSLCLGIREEEETKGKGKGRERGKVKERKCTVQQGKKRIEKERRRGSMRGFATTREFKIL